MTTHMLYSFISIDFYDDTGMSNGNLFFLLNSILVSQWALATVVQN